MSGKRPNDAPDSALLRVRLTPKGGKDALIRFDEDVLFARVSAPPVDGAANRALVVLISKELGIARSRVSFVSGETARNKVIRIDGMTAASLTERIAEILGSK